MLLVNLIIFLIILMTLLQRMSSHVRKYKLEIEKSIFIEALLYKFNYSINDKTKENLKFK